MSDAFLDLDYRVAINVVEKKRKKKKRSTHTCTHNCAAQWAQYSRRLLSILAQIAQTSTNPVRVMKMRASLGLFDVAIKFVKKRRKKTEHTRMHAQLCSSVSSIFTLVVVYSRTIYQTKNNNKQCRIIRALKLLFMKFHFHFFKRVKDKVVIKFDIMTVRLCINQSSLLESTYVFKKCE